MNLWSSVGLIIATIDEDLCSGCQICVSLCPYDALEYDSEKKVVKVKDVLCEGCGACISGCPSGAAQQKNINDKQIYEMVKVLCSNQK